MTQHDNMKACPQCGGPNDIRVKDRINHVVAEAETLCADCGHVDYWAYGFFQSGAGAKGGPMYEQEIQRFKRNAKQLKKQTGCTHSQALDQIARAAGWANWALLMKHLNPKGGHR